MAGTDNRKSLDCDTRKPFLPGIDNLELLQCQDPKGSFIWFSALPKWDVTPTFLVTSPNHLPGITSGWPDQKCFPQQSTQKHKSTLQVALFSRKLTNENWSHAAYSLWIALTIHTIGSSMPHMCTSSTNAPSPCRVYNYTCYTCAALHVN